MKMRRLFSLFLALIMLLSVSSVAMAEDRLTWKHYNRQEGNGMLEDDQAILDWVEEQVGFDIDISMYPANDYNQRMRLVFNGGEQFDSFGLLAYEANIELLKSNGLIIPWNDLLEQYGQNILKVYPENGFDLVKDEEGNIWALTRCEYNYRGNQPAIREDWVKQLGMEMPQTIEEFEAFMQAVLETDLNGNGIHDEIPLFPMSQLWGIKLDFSPIFLGFTGETYMDEEGRIMPIYAHPNYKQMLSKMHEWYEKGYIYKEFYTTNSMTDLGNANRVACYANYFMGGSTYDQVIEGCHYVALPPFQDAPGVAGWTCSPQFSTVMALSSTAEHPELAVKFLDWMLSDPANALTLTYGFEGRGWEWVDKEAKVYRTLPGWNDVYSARWKIVDSYFPGFWPTISTEDDPIMADREWLKNVWSKDWTYLPNMNNHFFFDYTNTEAEYFTGDGQTMLDEAMLKIIYGEMPVEEWDNVVANYMKLEGNTYSEIWTQQYNEKYAFKYDMEFMTTGK